jgi:hypothetical protein
MHNLLFLLLCCSAAVVTWAQDTWDQDVTHQNVGDKIIEMRDGIKVTFSRGKFGETLRCITNAGCGFHGTCQATAHHWGIATDTYCLCQEDYTGENCETWIGEGEWNGWPYRPLNPNDTSWKIIEPVSDILPPDFAERHLGHLKLEYFSPMVFPRFPEWDDPPAYSVPAAEPPAEETPTEEPPP